MNKSRIIIVLALLLIIFIGVLAAYSSIAIPNKLDYTQEELKDQYLKYNITENDIKFARGELPHYLEGTVLDGNTTTGGISTNESLTIEEDARKLYIEKYGVDPANPKVDEVYGILLPVEEVKRLIKIRSLIPSE
ncbi:MAG: hypothetical protein O8C62_11195 [Candidatus Methanoperedens sp.]|nr:hypothetical protein [Candidatus Methanoperedens sp.]